MQTTLNTKRKILVFTDWYLPGYKAGGPIKSVANILRTFSNEFDFYVVTSDRDFDSISTYPNIEINKWIGCSGGQVIYLSPSNQRKAKISQIIDGINPDVIYLNSLFSKKFSILPLRIARQKKIKNRVILAPRGMLDKGALRLKSFKKKSFLSATKGLGLFSGIRWHASTSAEKSEIESVFGKKAAVRIAENIGEYPDWNVEDRALKLQGKLKVLFVSRVSKKKNLLFAIEVIGECANKESIFLTVVGPHEDKNYIDRCVETAKNLNVQMSLVGAKTPAELGGFYNSHDLFFLPTLAENYGHCIIEALSYGCPVLISDQTPWTDLEKDGVGAALSLSRPSKFVQVIESFLFQTEEGAREQSVTCREYARSILLNDKVIEVNRTLFAEKVNV